MFTGIITNIGRVRAVTPRGDTRIEIACGYSPASIAIGGSIACSGVCLTVVEKGDATGETWFGVDVSAETMRATTLGQWRPGSTVNLERALKVGEELGGHILSGHVDGVGLVEDVTPEGESLRFSFEAPNSLMPYIASKGSIAVDGISLTVNEVEENRFTVNIIPHTRKMTTLRHADVNTKVNLEVDLLARYVGRLMERE